jgi:hypothetical protein
MRLIFVVDADHVEPSPAVANRRATGSAKEIEQSLFHFPTAV